MEPQSVARARLLPKAEISMFFVIDEKMLVGAVSEGTVVSTCVFSQEDDVLILERFVLAILKKYKGKPESIFVNEQTEFSRKFFLENGLQSESFELDPLYAVAIKKHLMGEDSHVLNIKTTKFSSSEDLRGDQFVFSGTFREKILALVFVVVLLSGIIFIKIKNNINLLAKKEFKKQIIIQNDNLPVKTEQPSTLVAENIKSEIVATKNYQELHILILNGGAKPGSAAKIKEALAKDSYLNIEAGNALSKDNLGQIIYYQKENLDGATKIKNDLVGDYPNIELKEAISEEQKRAEVVIILGK